MVRSGETDDELGGDENDRIRNGSEDGGGGGAEEDSNESLDDGEAHGRAGFDEDEPDGVANHKDKMNGEEGGARGISKEDETNADDKINKAGTEVEQPVAVIDGEDAPFRNDDKDETDNVAASDNGRANRNDGEE